MIFGVLLFVSAVASRIEAQENFDRKPGKFLESAATRLNPRRLLSGGKAKDHIPQLGRIYSRAAQADHGRRNPIIVIPGILGSKLVNQRTGNVAWGAMKFSQSKLFTRTQDSDVALPMQYGRPLQELNDSIVASEILEDIEVSLLGIPIQIEAYRDVLNTLGVGGYQPQAGRSLGTVDYGTDHFSCFEFHYDWRRDCAENAANLGKFIQERSAYVTRVRAEKFGIIDQPVRFDIVAHSMGGLIARYYLRYGSQPLPTEDALPELNWAGAANVETLIMVGTPNAGSVLALEQLVDGMQYSKAFPKYEAATLGTMPSVYQLLPRPRHQTVVCQDSGCNLNFYDWQVWRDHGWGLLAPKQDAVLQRLLPGISLRQRQAVATEHLQKCLWAAKQFHQAIDIPADPPSGTSQFLISGDSEMTTSRMSVSEKKSRLKRVDTSPGDGTVTRASSLMDERVGMSSENWTGRLQSPIRWSGTHFIFTNHLGLTSHPSFTDNALYLLLERQR